MMMTEQYRLVYSGEVLEGQHAAVVKKRLAALLKLDDERMNVLFSGKAVVVKRATDEKTSARYQQAFAEAGARLRVLPVAEDESPAAAPSAAGGATPAGSSSEVSRPADAEDQQPAAAGGLQVMPVGSEMLTATERPAVAATEVATEHLSLAEDPVVLDDTARAAPAIVPNVDHLSLAELGAQLGTNAAQQVVVAEIDAEFDLAEVGVILGSLEDEPVPPAPATDHLSIDEDQ